MMRCCAKRLALAIERPCPHVSVTDQFPLSRSLGMAVVVAIPVARTGRSHTGWQVDLVHGKPGKPCRPGGRATITALPEGQAVSCDPGYSRLPSGLETDRSVLDHGATTPDAPDAGQDNLIPAATWHA